MADETIDAAERLRIMFEEVQDQIRDPYAILGNALLRIHQADEHFAEARGDLATDALKCARYQAKTAEVLTGIAWQAQLLADRERWGKPPMLDDQHAADLGELAALDEPDMELRTVPPAELARELSYQPQPVQGVLFVADLDGWGMGIVAGREWLHVPGHGFIDISEADEVDGPEGTPPYRFAGRVVSATPDHALCITDGGVPVTLPRALIREYPDDQR